MLSYQNLARHRGSAQDRRRNSRHRVRRNLYGVRRYPVPLGLNGYHTFRCIVILEELSVNEEWAIDVGEVENDASWLSVHLCFSGRFRDVSVDAPDLDFPPDGLSSMFHAFEAAISWRSGEYS